MTDHVSPTEQLVQRFLDQELSADERIQFIVALGRDQMLRERVLEMERLVLDASTAGPASRSRWICRTGHGANRPGRSAVPTGWQSRRPTAFHELARGARGVA